MKSALTALIVTLLFFYPPIANARHHPINHRPAHTHLGVSAPWLQEAIRWVDAGPHQLGVRSTLWCAAGVNKFLKNVGVKGTNSDMARSFSNYGKASKPVPGAIAVMKRGKTGGHVAVVVRDLGTHVLTVSPNSHGKVRYVKFAKASIYAYRWPVVA